jgi:uncharacterized protein
MIKIKLIKQDGLVNRIEITGHAKYGQHGKDIVCAAVSSSVLTTINGIICLDKEALDYNQDDNGLSIIIKKHNQLTDTLINNMINMLKELESDYEKHIKIIEEV